MPKTISIASEFSRTPGARYKSDGPFSGQEFRERFLEPCFLSVDASDRVRVILDGVDGYATSFLEEAFGGLAREFGSQLCLQRLEFVSEDDPLLIEEVQGYIKHATDH